MAEQEKPDIEREKNNEATKEKTSVKANTQQNDAGPSASISLPGAIQETVKPYLIKTGLSKSEHNIRNIITDSDLANALKSLNFNLPIQQNKSKNNELKLDILAKDVEEKDPTTFVDLKKFMASCFKINKETLSGTMLSEIPNANVQAIPAFTNENPVTSSNVCSEHVESKSNEVVVTNTKGIDQKSSRASSEKKKASRNSSERSDLRVAARDSLSSIGSNVCRICMTKGRERLISPCNCKGSMANVHLSCLERWLNQVGRNHCELCGYSYPAIRTPRYTVLQALRLWFGNPRNRGHLQSDCLIFWLLSTVTAGLLAVCIVGTQYFVIEGNKFGKLDAGLRKEEGISHRITETAMDFFMAIVLCGYSVTVYLLWKDHYVMWNRWRRANVNVRLLLSPDANPVPFVPRPTYNII